MIKRLLAVAFIFVCTSVAWAILAGTIEMRTHSSDEHLRGRVQSVWGTSQIQYAPLGEYWDTARHTLVPASSDVAVDLNLEYRQKGLLWYSTYRVGFQGDFAF